MLEDNLVELKRINNVANPKATSINTDCLECHKDISIPLRREDVDILRYVDCCGIRYCLEDVVDLVVYRLEEDKDKDNSNNNV